MLAVQLTEMNDRGPKILDLSYLQEAADGDASFIRAILSDYLGEMARYVVELKASASNPDLAVVARVAHTIRGASANVGASRVRETASHLEAQVKKGQLQGFQSLVELLGQELSRVRELVERQSLEDLLKAS